MPELAVRPAPLSASSTASPSVWRQFFRDWPEGLPPGGVLVTTYDEQIPFLGYMTGEDMLLLERRNPDTVGARKIVIPYSNIAALKITDVVKQKPFLKAGFEEPQNAKPARRE